MRKCVLSFMHRALAGSVRAWAQMADEGARKAAVMGGALGRLRNRDWARALIQWVAYTDETLRVKEGEPLEVPRNVSSMPLKLVTESAPMASPPGTFSAGRELNIVR